MKRWWRQRRLAELRWKLASAIERQRLTVIAAGGFKNVYYVDQVIEVGGEVAELKSKIEHLEKLL